PANPSSSSPPTRRPARRGSPPAPSCASARARSAAVAAARTTSPRAAGRTPARSRRPWRRSLGSSVPEPGMRPGVRLGVDVGSVRVGVASCDPDGVLATPVETVPRDEESGGDLRRVLELLEDLGAVEVVVGLPRSLDGTEGPAAEGVRRWAKRLLATMKSASFGNTPIRLVDERLTTVDAHRG